MKTWMPFSPNELLPTGWVKRQLEIQAEGLSGHLHEVWPDVRDSAWIGGECEGWERVPYWLDGFIPLAYLLDRQDLIAVAQKYMDAIINSQQPSGWICPCAETEIPNYDTWAVQLISKVLVVYYECSGDTRVPEVLWRMMHNYYDLLKSGHIKLFDWGEYRWFEAFIALNFLYDRYNEAWIVELGEMLSEQGADFNQNIMLWKKPLSKVVLATHIVGIAMMLKYEAISHTLLGKPYENKAEYFHKILHSYNGTPTGTYTGDEHLSGLSPIQGTELCAVVEQMYSFEQLFAYTGDYKWLDRLELLAFNALPATISDDMWTHQYDQMSNQIACVRFPRKSIFGTNGSEAHLFGLEPNFGCCTANFSQGWPKFTLSAFFHNGDTILNALPIPSKLRTDTCSIEIITEYPFAHSFKYVIETEKDITFLIRIPSFAKTITVDGTTYSLSSQLEFPVLANTKRVIHMSFEVEAELVNRPHNLKTVQWGSLVFSLPIAYEQIMCEYTANGVERKFPYCDYEYVGHSAWNYGYSDVVFDVVQKKVGEVPFSSIEPPVTVKAKVKPIPWETEPGYENVCAKIPGSTFPLGDEETVELYPYGCAKLRMTELPLV